MKLLALDPTPNPNSMKLTVAPALPRGVRRTFTRDHADGAPQAVQRILQIDGVQSVFMSADFMAIQREARADWGPLLAEARAAFEERADEGGSDTVTSSADDAWRELRVSVQYFREIPMLIKLSDGQEEQRVALAQRFADAVQDAAREAKNMLMERRWRDEGVRYGDLGSVGRAMAEEIDAAFDERRLAGLVARAGELGEDGGAERRPLPQADPETLRAELHAEDWRAHFRAMKRLGARGVPPAQLEAALSHPRMPIRRLAAVYLGMLEGNAFDPVPSLCRALEDDAVAVRRTAGDALTDLGDARAMLPMARCLRDANKLVRWRAARFLFEHGDDRVLAALDEARDDPEYEVRMQVRQATERLSGGHDAQGTVWQQMTRKQDD